MNRKHIATGIFLALLASASGGALRTWCGPSGEQDWSSVDCAIGGYFMIVNDGDNCKR